MHLELYHGSSSVCSSKVRIGLAEKGLDWVSRPVNLKAGEQNDPDYLKLNPNGVVPTLVTDDQIVVESSVILEYIDEIGAGERLMPTQEPARTQARIWLTRCIDIHAAINTMTFSTVQRQKILAANTPAQIDAMIARMANPATASKRRDMIDNGLKSPSVDAAFFTLKRMLDDMQTALDKHAWLLGNNYSIADAAILSYVDRLDRLGQSGLWAERTPAVQTWLANSRARPSYAAISDYIPDAEAESTRAEGEALWPEVKVKWDGFLSGH